jgi:hypothetical protein
VFQFTESIPIAAPPNEIWKNFVDIAKWWPPSNQEHTDIDVKSHENPIDVGTEVVFEERIAGIKGKAVGSITRWVPEREATWEGEAVYRYYGIPFRIREGVSWLLESHGKTSQLSARVWAEFPSTLFGRFLEWYTTKLLNVVDRDREHARRELEYLKHVIESTG